GIKATNRNQNYLVPGPVLRIRDHTAFSTEKCADTEICDEECDSPESINQQTQEESPIEVHTAEGVPVAAEVRAISEDYDIETENNSSESLQDQTDEEPPAKFCKLLDKSEALNVTAQQKWPLLRANSSGLYKRELCEFNRKYFSDLKQHMILKHKCKFLYQYASDRTSKLHEEDPYICKCCDYKTVIFENLSQHTADTHFSDHLYWCEQCDVQFSSSSELYLHFQEHSCDEQYLCQFCEHEMNDPEDLHSHVVNEHACKLLELSDKYNNGEHGQPVAIEHTKIFAHVCDDCGKGFSSMLEYCKHLNSHLSEGIYLCQYREYSTGQIEDLKIQLDFRHSADLPHKCSDCLMRFGNERELISHLPVHETTRLFSLTSIMM
ncbi:hypothetical protein EI555_020663, partial [Monodon monoceros]